MSSTPQVPAPAFPKNGPLFVDSATPRPFSFCAGQILRKAREKRKLTLDQVSQSLCLSRSVLEALEEGRYRELSQGEAYLIGFVRSYARLVRIDPERIIQKIKEELPPSEKTAELIFPAPLPVLGYPRRFVLFLSVVVTGGFLFFGTKLLMKGEGETLPERLPDGVPFISGQRPLPCDKEEGPLVKEDSSVKRGLLLKNDPLVKKDLLLKEDSQKEGPLVKNALRSTAKGGKGNNQAPFGVRKTEVTSAEIKNAEMKSTPSMAKGALSSEPLSQEDPAFFLSDKDFPPNLPHFQELIPLLNQQSQGKQIQGQQFQRKETQGRGAFNPAALSSQSSGVSPRLLVLEATERSWVQIKDAQGKIVFAKLMHPGEVYEIQENASLFFSTGNMGGVSVRQGGRLIQSMGKSGRVQKNIPLTFEKLRELSLKEGSPQAAYDKSFLSERKY